MGNAVVEVGLRVVTAVRTASIDVERVMERMNASRLGVCGIKRHTSAGWNANRTGVSAKVVIERPVLLHDDDHVTDLGLRLGMPAVRRFVRQGGLKEREHSPER